MRLENTIVLIIIGTIALYAIFLFLADFTLIQEKISNFKIIYLPLILFLVTLSLIPLFIRWHFLLRNSNIHIPVKNSFLIFLSGGALSITPGQIGDLLKSQIMKKKFNIPRTDTTAIILSEKIYDLTAAIIASIIGIIILGMDIQLTLIAISILATIFFLIYYRPAFIFFLNQIKKIKFISKYTQNLSDSYDTLRRSTSTKTASISLPLSITYWLIISIAVYYTFLAFDVNILNYLDILFIYVLSVLFGAISFVPGGIGVTEGTIVGLLTINGIDVSTALILSVMARIMTLWYPACIGFICLKFSVNFSFKEDSK
tara:strand:- start:1441 stop:2385 length:945 start_codon:yes stop_codon:yes gene_type:complete